MRRILRAICETALQENKADNARTTQISEAYAFIDRQFDGMPATGPAPAKMSEALTVADFPLYFARTLSRMVLDRYNYQVGAWKQYTKMDQVPDYTEAERYRFTETERLERRRDKEESYATYIEEAQFKLAVDDYAKQIDFSRRVLVNDDLGAFNDIPLKMADSARRFEDWYVSALYDNALTQAALVALGANYSGTGRLTTANLAIAYNAFAQRVDGQALPLAISPTYLVIPKILELQAKTILQSEKIAELATNATNVLRGSLQIVVDPYIIPTAPNIQWYLFAAPSDVAAIHVARMQGVAEGPRMYMKAPDKLAMSPSGGLGGADWRLGSFISGDIEMEVETTIGSRTDDLTGLVGVCDSNGVYYSAGTTP